jgi:hypothetical protein
VKVEDLTALIGLGTGVLVGFVLGGAYYQRIPPPAPCPEPPPCQEWAELREPTARIELHGYQYENGSIAWLPVTRDSGAVIQCGMNLNDGPRPDLEPQPVHIGEVYTVTCDDVALTIRVESEVANWASACTVHSDPVAGTMAVTDADGRLVGYLDCADYKETEP